MSLNDEEFSTLVRLSKKVLWSSRETRRKLQEHKLNITPANFYSSIPSVLEYENSFEFKGEDRINGSYLSPTVFDESKTTEFLSAIKRYSYEFDPPRKERPNEKAHFYWDNSSFSYMDAMSYYCILRHYKPNRIVEVGAGNSTLVADAALRKNGFGRITIIEPYPLDYLKELDAVEEIRECAIQDIELGELRCLIESAEILFVDSTHTVKVGSDCLYIYLKLLPSIRSNLVVHAHDIALPYAQPIKNMDRHVYWTEQYLLYAYLLDNPKTNVLTGSLYAQRKVPTLSHEVMNGRYPDGGGSLWFSYYGS